MCVIIFSNQPYQQYTNVKRLADGERFCIFRTLWRYKNCIIIIIIIFYFFLPLVLRSQGSLKID